MSILFDEVNSIFTIETLSSKYIFQIIKGMNPVHIYYGKKDGEVKAFETKFLSFSPYYQGQWFFPDTCMSEYVGFDSGDYRNSSLRIKNPAGDSTTVLEYTGYDIFKGRLELTGLPFADADENTETLEIKLVDKVTDVAVSLYYTVFWDKDVISRYVKITNNNAEPVVIEKCMSLLLDLPDHNYDMISLYGRHEMERSYQRTPLVHGTQSVYSRRGASSHQYNPFIALCAKDADEEKGDVYGFNFVFSGNFLDEVEVDQTEGTRVQIGLGSENFSYKLFSGESFISPEAVMTYSDSGIGKMTRNFHNFIRGHILPPEPFEKRPVVLNTWEACYFNINQDELLRFAESAANAGIDMLVMDDGWFGERKNDLYALGDWYVNREKFPEGLKPFVDKVKSYGIKFGIWIEPEMVNPNSDLYRAHPDWCIHCKGRERMVSRHQLVLDMGNPEVVEYLKDTFTKVFDGVDIDYFKWDVNRHMSQVASAVLPVDQQGEAAYRHMLGVYEFYRWFKEKYPNALLENCSGGGGRYDLGMMKYSTMIWTSDNTEPQARVKIQYSSLLAYPAATMSCHVGNRYNLCEDPKRLKHSWEVAIGGALGYELHLPNMSDTVKETVKNQISAYREYEDLILWGDYYSVANPFESNYSAYYYTNADRSRILVSYLQHEGGEAREITVPVRQAVEGAVYIEQNSGREYTAEELKRGVTVMSDESNCNSQTWYFIKK